MFPDRRTNQIVQKNYSPARHMLNTYIQTQIRATKFFALVTALRTVSLGARSESSYVDILLFDNKTKGCFTVGVACLFEKTAELLNFHIVKCHYDEKVVIPT